jgi:predicted RNase H-like HicB family nuclease
MGYKLGWLFGKGFSAENSQAVETMNEEIRKVGGLLHFNIQTDATGWHAQCVEIDGIITGGKSLNPTDAEVQENIREAIHTAFSITREQEEKPISNASEFQAVYNFTTNALA